MVVKYWLQLFLLPIYFISFLFPRKKTLWAFGSTFGRRWADNGRYFYLYMSQHEAEKVTSVWITRKKEIATFLQNEGMKAYHILSLKGIWYCLRANVYVFDNYSKDISFYLSGGATKINLWHGSGNKKINHDNRFDYVRHPRNIREWCSTFLIRITNEKPTDYTLATSPMKAEIFASAFQAKEGHIIVDGYPRNDAFLTDNITNILTSEEKKILDVIQNERTNGKVVAIYMPTFRPSETKFFKVMNLELFNDFLVKQNIMYFTKLHPKSKVKDAFDKIKYSNIINIDADVDPYVFLNKIDLLVTDYSSIYTDFLLLDRPSVLFPFDIDEYSSDTRDSYFPYDEYMPECKAYNMEELMQCISSVLKVDIGHEGRMKLRNKMFATIDGNSSERLAKKIYDIVKM